VTGANIVATLRAIPATMVLGCQRVDHTPADKAHMRHIPFQHVVLQRLGPRSGFAIH
jgi:hypothetical protein